MNISTAYNHLKRFEQRARDVYGSARYTACTHGDILNSLGKQIYSDDAWGKCPSWVRQKVQTITSELSNQIYKPDLHASELETMLLAAAAGEAVKPARYVRWVLRVDGIERNTDWICAARAAGDEDVWERVVGAHCWNHKIENRYSLERSLSLKSSKEVSR